MKKMGKYITILLLVCSYLMVGCGNNSEKTKLVSLDKVREEIPSVLEDIKNGEYSNLAIEDINVSITDSNEIYKLKIGYKDNYFDDREKFVKEIPNIIKYLFQDDNLDVDTNKIRESNMNKSYESLLLDAGEEVPNEPLVIEYLDEERYCFFTGSFSQFWVDKGNLKKLYGNGNEDFLSFVSDNFEEIRNFSINNNIDFKNEKYKLIDGEYSIQEAVDYVENYYNNEFKYSFNKDLSLEVYEIDVLKLDDNTYAYNMLYREKYNGIPFDALRNGAVSSDAGTRRFDMGNCIVSNKDSIEFRTGAYSNVIVTEEGDGINKIIPLDGIIKKVSNTLTNETLFTIESINLIYSLEGRDTLEATPVWKITASNSKDNTTLFIYCDILTGEVSTANFRM